MGPIEMITAALKLADTIAQIRLVKLQALTFEGQTAEVIKPGDAEDEQIKDLRAFAVKVYEDAANFIGMFKSLGGKIHDAIHDDKPA